MASPAARDIERWFDGKRPAWPKLAWSLMIFAGLRAVILMRCQAWLAGRGWSALSKLVYSANFSLHGVEFLPGAQIGAGLVVRHPLGIVVGRGAVVGIDCTLLQGVTLGERHVDGSGDHRYPVLDDEVVVGANAIVLGGVTVGRAATVGAGAVVLSDVPAASLAVGNPAHVVLPDGPHD